MQTEIQEQVSSPQPATTSPVNPSGQVTLNRNHLISIIATALFVSFFLPWVSFLGSSLSGMAIQEHFESYRLVLALPIFAVVVLIATVVKQPTDFVRRLAGVTPFLILAVAMQRMGTDMFQIVSYGGWLALASGAVLIAIPNGPKPQPKA